MKKTLLLIGILATAFQVNAQSTDELYTVVSKYNAQTGSTTRMGKLNPTDGIVTNVGEATSPNIFSVTGGSLNQTTNRFNLVSTNFMMSFDIFTGNIINELPITSFYEGTTYFANVRYNNSNNKLYGLASTFTENNQLIITASKNGAKPTPAPSKKPVVKPKPVVSKKSVPKPIVKNVPPKKVSPVKAKPKAAPAKKLSSTSLSDRLIKLLPVGDINFQPEHDALVNLPVYFWTQTPQRFSAVVPILDLIVYVNLYSTFTWSFGDGRVITTTNQGASFPLGQITNTYRSNGDHPVNLKISWRGTFTVNGVTTPISGNGITQSITRDISVVNAVGRFTK